MPSRNRAPISGIALPSGLTEIGGGTFRHCDGLTEITVPDGVTKIGNRAFADCANLKTVIVPDSVVSIDTLAFDSSPHAAIACYSSSHAESWAAGKRIPVLLLDARNDPAGDANGDGTADMKDVLTILRFVRGMEASVPLYPADVNGDLAVDVRDAGLLLQFVCGWNTDLR